MLRNKAYSSHSVAKSIAALSVGTPIEERTVTTNTMLALGMLGTASEEANVSSLVDNRNANLGC